MLFLRELMHLVVPKNIKQTRSFELKKIKRHNLKRPTFKLRSKSKHICSIEAIYMHTTYMHVNVSMSQTR